MSVTAIIIIIIKWFVLICNTITQTVKKTVRAASERFSIVIFHKYKRN